LVGLDFYGGDRCFIIVEFESINAFLVGLRVICEELGSFDMFFDVLGVCFFGFDNAFLSIRFPSDGGWQIGVA
jgi:hypothetical protein